MKKIYQGPAAVWLRFETDEDVTLSVAAETGLLGGDGSNELEFPFYDGGGGSAADSDGDIGSSKPW